VIREWVSCQKIAEGYAAVEHPYSLVVKWTRLETVMQISGFQMQSSQTYQFKLDTYIYLTVCFKSYFCWYAQARGMSEAGEFFYLSVLSIFIERDCI
jgi:hypothetical protein